MSRGRRDAFRSAQPSQGMACMWNGAQLRAKAIQCRGGDIGAKIRRQLAVGGRLDEGEHVGRAAPEEVAGDELGRDRNADAYELVGRPPPRSVRYRPALRCN